MTTLITGISGFVGRHLTRHLLARGYDVHGTIIADTDRLPQYVEAGLNLYKLDLTDPARVHQLITDLKPDHIFHLAAQAFVPRSLQDPWETLGNNIRAQLNILEAVARSELSTRTLVVSSGEVYGRVRPDQMPIGEDQLLSPTNPYSVSKVAQDMLGLQYSISHGLDVIRVRPFNHIGTGQSEHFVAPAFAKQIAEIEAGHKAPVVRVGNLVAQRDFTDVRDVIRAYEFLIQSGESGEVYNIGSGEAHSIQELLDTLLSMSNKQVRVEIDPARNRPVDVPIIICDASRLRATTGWVPEYTFKQSLADVLNDCRERVQDAEVN